MYISGFCNYQYINCLQQFILKFGINNKVLFSSIYKHPCTTSIGSTFTFEIGEINDSKKEYLKAICDNIDFGINELLKFNNSLELLYNDI